MADLFRTLFQTSPDAEALLHAGVFVEVNGLWVHETGWTREELLGKTPAVLGLWTEPAGATVRLHRRDGRASELELRTRQISDGDRELTWLRLRDMALGGARLHALTSATFEGIAMSENGIVIDSNTQLEEIFGYPPGGLHGLPIAELSAPETRALVVQAVRSGLEGPYEHVGRRRDGSTDADRGPRARGRSPRSPHPLLGRAATSPSGAGSSSSLRDRRSSSSSSSPTQIQEVFWLYDLATGDVIYVSPAWATIFGTAPDSVLGPLERRLAVVVGAADRERIRRAICDAAAFTRLEYRATGAAGERVIIERIYPLAGEAACRRGSPA